MLKKEKVFSEKGKTTILYVYKKLNDFAKIMNIAKKALYKGKNNNFNLCHI